MAESLTSGALRSQKSYHANSESINRVRAIQRIERGLGISEQSVINYRIKLSDIRDQTKLRDDVRQMLTTRESPVIYVDADEDDEYDGIDESQYVFPFDELVALPIQSGPNKGELNHSEKTIIAYKSSLCALMKLLGYTNEMKFYFGLRDVDRVMALLKSQFGSYYNKKHLPAILLVSKVSRFGELFGKDVINRYRSEMKYKQWDDAIQAKRSANIHTKLKKTWDEILLCYNILSQSEPYSQKHLLLSLYVKIPPLRDNWGHVKIYQRRPIKLKGSVEDYYILSEKKFYLYNQKNATSGKRELVIIDITTKEPSIIYDYSVAKPYK
jgi:hypothetical protein